MKAESGILERLFLTVVSRKFSQPVEHEYLVAGNLTGHVTARKLLVIGHVVVGHVASAKIVGRLYPHHTTVFADNTFHHTRQGEMSFPLEGPVDSLTIKYIYIIERAYPQKSFVRLVQACKKTAAQPLTSGESPQILGIGGNQRPAHQCHDNIGQKTPVHISFRYDNPVQR